MTAPTPLVLFAHDASSHELGLARSVLPGVQVEALPSDRAGRRQLLPRAAVLLAKGWQIPRTELGLLAHLGFVQRVWTGVERIPFTELLTAAPDCVFAANPGPNATAVSEHALGLYLDCAKRITWRDRAARRGAWEQDTPGHPIEGSRIGLLGYGAIGQRLGQALTGLGAHVIAANRTGRAPAGIASSVEVVTSAGLSDVRNTLDGLIVAAPATRRLRGVIDTAWLRGMRRDAILVNIARGSLIDEDDLWAHLVANPDFFAGIDAQWRYPDEGDTTYAQNHEFARLENIVITPHAAWNVPGIQDRMLVAAAENVARFLDGSPVVGKVEPADYV